MAEEDLYVAGISSHDSGSHVILQLHVMLHQSITEFQD